MLNNNYREEAIKLTIQTSISFIKSMALKMKDDFITAFSAQAAFFIIISFFPFVMFLLTLIQSVYTESTLMLTFTSIIPEAFDSYVISIISEIYDKTSGTVISVTAITTLWSASRAFLSIVKGFNSVYDIEETRNYFKLRIIATFYTLIFALMLIVSLGFLVFGNQIYIEISASFPVLNKLALLIISLRTIVGLCVLTLFFTVLYIAIPDRKTRVWSEVPGALLAAFGWMGFSYLYSYYIDHMSNYSNMYGSLTAIVLLMLWLYFCMYILFVGAEFNVILARKKELEEIHLK